ncbi:MAG: histidinol dehydrogenase [Gemmatimonadaceae bacterium]|nr:histidinol dehydrogenase [Gemmatimonadaceae bacterium]
MKIVEYPLRETWSALLERPGSDKKEIATAVEEIVETVRCKGVEALRRYGEKFDGVRVDNLAVDEAEFEDACSEVPDDLRSALLIAKANIEKFHAVEKLPQRKIETTAGVVCWSRTVPIERVGLYVPAGSAPLFSTVLMLAIPARLAGCPEVVMCSPPRVDGTIDPATLFAARLCGVTKVFKVGGAQAIAAMAFGTATVPRVDKIFGPGNRYVTEAKLQVTRYGTTIDMAAGPSELAVVADESCVPAFVAADLLSQAEHGADSQVLLVCPSREVVDSVVAEIEEQLPALPRAVTVRAAIHNSKAIVVTSITEGLDIINEYGPEHLIIATRDPETDANAILNAGSIFLGNFSCESAGDYASGTNHTLPTNGSARGSSGISVSSFMKTITLQRLSRDGIENLGPTIETMAAAEGLEAHRRAVSIRRALQRGANDGV